MASTGLPHGPAGLAKIRSCVELTRRPRRCYAWLRRRYGEIVTVYAGGGPFVLALTSDGARELLSRDRTATRPSTETPSRE
jgi:hypothetical protein